MDGAKIHKAEMINEMFANRLNLQLIPSYSPELNPIERVWSVFKSWLRAVEIRNDDQVILTASNMMQRLEERHMRGSFIDFLENCRELASASVGERE